MAVPSIRGTSRTTMKTAVSSAVGCTTGAASKHCGSSWRRKRWSGALLTLPGEQQQILHWRYVDQFPDAEVARMLKIAATGPDLLNVAAGRERSLDAYGALCQEIDRLVPQKDSRAGLGSLDPRFRLPPLPGGRRGDLRPGR